MKNTIKKMSMLIAVMVVAVVCFAFSASATTSDEGFVYYVSNGEVIITDYEGTETELAIPNEIDGYPVTTIGDNAFSGCNFEEITLPNSLTTIGNSVFSSCNNLTRIVVDKNNKYYSSDEHGVLFNKNKTTLIRFPIGNKKNNYNIPDSVTIIGSNSFEDCSTLKNVTIPNGVIDINTEAFENCRLLHIIIPASVINIDKAAFISNDATIKITVDENNKYYSNDEYGVLFNKEKTRLIQYPSANIRTKYTIPDSVTDIADSAFLYSRYLKSITLPNSITSIGDGAFSYCSALMNINIPDNVTEIGNNSFIGCENLKNIKIPNGIESVKSGTFFRCKKITAITLPNSVVRIEMVSFHSCINLAKILIPDSVVYIGGNAFYDCPSLTDIYYTGSEEQWNQIDIYDDNLFNVTIHFNHKHTYTQTVTPLTCTKDGYTTNTCECGDSYISDYIEATGHTMGEFVLVREATCTESGKKESKCAACGYTETERISILGHTDENEDGICEVCSEKVKELSQKEKVFSILKEFFEVIKDFFKNIFKF